MKSILKLTIIIFSLLLVNACSSEADPTDPAEPAPEGSDGLGTGETNEVVLTLENTDVDTFDVSSFTQDIADATGASLDQIVITSVNGFTRSGVYVSFYFEDSEDPDGLNASQCLTSIQQELQNGSIGDYTATIIITNTDDNFECFFVEDCAGICNGSTQVSNCGVCGGSDNAPNQGYCDCAGEPYGNGSLDECGDCNGGNSAMDICGVCNGNGSSCDLGQLVDTYRLEEVRIYANSDCSGSPMIVYDGPNIDVSENYSSGSGCEIENNNYQATLSMYIDIKSDGTYLWYRTEDELDDYSYCYDGNNWSNCDNGECYSCETNYQDAIEIDIEEGNFSIEDGMILLAPSSYKEIVTGTEYGSNSDCGEETSYNYTHNGCLDEFYGYNDYSYVQFFQYESSGNRLYLRSSNSDYGYDYYGYDYYGYDYYGDDNDGFDSCTEYEFKSRSLPSISGCTDEDSMVYNPFATSDNGTCDQGPCEGSYMGDYLNNNNENNGNNNKSFLYPMVRKKIKND